MDQNKPIPVSWLTAYSAGPPSACSFLAWIVFNPEDGSDTFF
jgi:hypothetical protein